MRINITKAIALLIALNIATLAQEKGSFTDDRDKKTYKTVKIGEQVWMAENLNFEASNSKCYDNKPANCAKYGRLYDWAMAMALPDYCNSKCDSTREYKKSICPAGWRLPDTSEWNVLVNIAGGTNMAGKILKAKSGWNKNGNGDDKSGFSALPGGYGNSDSSFGNVGNTGSWWTSDGMLDPGMEAVIYSSAIRQGVKGAGGSVNSIAKSIYHDHDYFDQGAAPRSGYRSIRCLQNDEKYYAAKKAEEDAKKAEEEAKKKAEAEAAAKTEAYVKANGGTFTDTRDKKTYKTIKINGQVWMAENLNYAVEKSKSEKSKCYENKPENCTKYGSLYNGITAMDLPFKCANKGAENDNDCAIKTPHHKGICPAGWHLPKNAEWDKLYRSADGTSGTESPYNSRTAGKFLKSANGWFYVNAHTKQQVDGSGTDKFGFSALPGGQNDDGRFKNINGTGYWWSASEDAYYREMNTSDEASYSTADSRRAYSYMSYYYSVRCIKD